MPATPSDLVDLERDRRRATADLIAFSDRVSAERWALFPAPEQWAERATWPPEQADELERLRGAERELVLAIHRHPAVQRALADHTYSELDRTVRATAAER